MLFLLQKATERDRIGGVPPRVGPLRDPVTGVTEFDNHLDGYLWYTNHQNGWRQEPAGVLAAEAPDSVGQYILSTARVRVTEETVFSFLGTIKSSNKAQSWHGGVGSLQYYGNILRFRVCDPSLAQYYAGDDYTTIHDETIGGWHVDHVFTVTLQPGVYDLVFEHAKVWFMANSVDGHRYDSTNDLTWMVAAYVAPAGSPTNEATISGMSEILPLMITVSNNAIGDQEGDEFGGEMDGLEDPAFISVRAYTPTSFEGALDEIGPGIIKVNALPITQEVNSVLPLARVTVNPLNVGSWWTVPPTLSGQMTDIYVCILTGADDGLDDLRIPISSFTARMRSAEPSYLGVVIPAITDYEDEINLRQNGDIEIWKGFRDINGTEHLERIISVNFDYLRLDQGAASASGTMVGYRQRTNDSPTERTVSNISYRAVSESGTLRLRGDVDLFVQPGDTCVFGTDEFVIDTITYIVTPQLAYMEVAE
jgi:hypothetical protein